jgi:hypothetical protein
VGCLRAYVSQGWFDDRIDKVRHLLRNVYGGWVRYGQVVTFGALDLFAWLVFYAGVVLGGELKYVSCGDTQSSCTCNSCPLHRDLYV